jgi:type VI secretion system secreted protein Hcp
MAVDYFLRIEGIEGESADAKHKGEIDVLSWAWGVSNSGAVGVGGGTGAGKATVQDLQFTKQMSKASPKLFLACATGQHLKQARLSAVRTAGAKQAEFLALTLTDVMVSSYQTGGSEGGDVSPMDQVSLNFAKLALEYKGQKADGSLDVPVVAGWDAKTNTKV